MAAGSLSSVRARADHAPRLAPLPRGRQRTCRPAAYHAITPGQPLPPHHRPGRCPAGLSDGPPTRISRRFLRCSSGQDCAGQARRAAPHYPVAPASPALAPPSTGDPLALQRHQRGSHGREARYCRQRHHRDRPGRRRIDHRRGHPVGPAARLAERATAAIEKPPAAWRALTHRPRDGHHRSRRARRRHLPGGGRL